MHNPFILLAHIQLCTMLLLCLLQLQLELLLKLLLAVLQLLLPFGFCCSPRDCSFRRCRRSCCRWPLTTLVELSASLHRETTQ
jgi:hypothetical protein